MDKPKKRTLNELRQTKTYGYRAPEEVKKNAPDAPGEKEEITVDGGEIEVTVTATELQIMHAKLDRLDSKIEFLLKHLEL